MSINLRVVVISVDRNTPVSYTHLDVYKRQRLDCVKGAIKYVVVSVSYTHLDVYKRQTLDVYTNFCKT